MVWKHYIPIIWRWEYFWVHERVHISYHTHRHTSMDPKGSDCSPDNMHQPQIFGIIVITAHLHHVSFIRFDVNFLLLCFTIIFNQFWLHISGPPSKYLLRLILSILIIHIPWNANEFSFSFSFFLIKIDARANWNAHCSVCVDACLSEILIN